MTGMVKDIRKMLVNRSDTDLSEHKHDVCELVTEITGQLSAIVL